jgi:putative sigma-54 modulation protein
MRINIKTRNGVPSDSLKQYAEKKVRKLSRYFHSIQEVDLVQATERGQHIVELDLQGDGVHLRSHERAGDLNAAVDSAVDKMERQLKRFKSKLRHEHERDSVAAAEPESEPYKPRIARRKKHMMKPMSAEEAARNMELLDHSFYLFENSVTGEANVLYRRRDGSYGLIEPDT